METNCKCSHFIGYFNHMMSNFSHLNPESVVTLFKSYCCSFYGLPRHLGNFLNNCLDINMETN